jgi:outer membrane protein OmpA-like peptidoglycan-associated protein/tetratricopeptide (TPR) repeat protein
LQFIILTMTKTQLPILFFCLISAFVLRGQKLEKANDFYRKGYYAAAIPIYEEALKKKSSLIAKSKLADCYRILNQAEKAAVYYAELLAEKDPNFKDVFHMGEVMMMRAKYDSARYFFTKYTEMQPEDEKGFQLIKACDDIKGIKPLLINVKIYPFNQNTEADENAPVFLNGELIYASDRNQGTKFMKEKNQTAGRDYYSLWAASKITDFVYTEPKEYSRKLNNLNQNTSSVSFTADGKQAFFFRNSDVPSKANAYNMQLYSAESKDGKSWSNIEKLSFCSTETNYFYPSVSGDGKHLFFMQEKGGGFGGFDIYVSHRTKKGWSRPENLGANVNTDRHEAFPYLAPNGKLYFCSKGHIGFGGFDIFVTEKDDNTGEWAKPVNLGTPINSAYDDISICFLDSMKGAFASPRGGNGDDIYFFEFVSGKNADGKDTTQLSELLNVGNYVYSMKTAKSDGTDNINDLSSFFDADTSFLHNSYLDSLANELNDKSLQKGRTYIIEGIEYTSSDAWDITTTMSIELDKLADILGLYRDLNVEIHAHTEGVNITRPKAVSEKRANLILEYLVAKGINRKRLTAKSWGDTQPLKDCKNGGCEEGEDMRNRRIELKVIGF